MWFCATRDTTWSNPARPSIPESHDCRLRACEATNTLLVWCFSCSALCAANSKGHGCECVATGQLKLSHFCCVSVLSLWWLRGGGGRGRDTQTASSVPLSTSPLQESKKPPLLRWWLVLSYCKGDYYALFPSLEWLPRKHRSVHGTVFAGVEGHSSHQVVQNDNIQPSICNTHTHWRQSAWTDLCDGIHRQYQCLSVCFRFLLCLTSRYYLLLRLSVTLTPVTAGITFCSGRK